MVISGFFASERNPIPETGFLFRKSQLSLETTTETRFLLPQNTYQKKRSHLIALTSPVGTIALCLFLLLFMIKQKFQN